MTGERDGAWGFDEDQPELVKYEHADDYGHTLLIRSSYDLPNTACVRTSQAVWVTAADLPGIVAGLYRAAGQEPPIILPRHSPEMSWVTDDGQVRPLFVPSEAMTPESIRDLCSWYASAADLAETVAEQKRQEAEREQVEELVELMYQADVLDGSEWAAARAEKIARAILAAGYARTEEKA